RRLRRARLRAPPSQPLQGAPVSRRGGLDQVRGAGRGAAHQPLSEEPRVGPPGVRRQRVDTTVGAGDTKLSAVDTTEGPGDTKSLAVDTTTSVVDTRVPAGDTTKGVGDTRFQAGDTTENVGDTRNYAGDTPVEIRVSPADFLVSPTLAGV